jgi:hypothetical protein
MMRWFPRVYRSSCRLMSTGEEKESCGCDGKGRMNGGAVGEGYRWPNGSCPMGQHGHDPKKHGPSTNGHDTIVLVPARGTI